MWPFKPRDRRLAIDDQNQRVLEQMKALQTSGTTTDAQAHYAVANGGGPAYGGHIGHIGNGGGPAYGGHIGHIGNGGSGGQGVPAGSRFYLNPDPTQAFEQAARDVASETPREVISAEDRDTVAFHVDNIASVLQSVQNRRQSITESRAARREQFEADDAADAARIAELDRLTAVYEAALLTARADGPVITGDLKGLGMHEQAVDPAKLTETGAKIARTRRKASKRETFTIPEGHEAVRDAEGRATGETRPINAN